MLKQFPQQKNNHPVIFLINVCSIIRVIWEGAKTLSEGKKKKVFLTIQYHFH